MNEFRQKNQPPGEKQQGTHNLQFVLQENQRSLPGIPMKPVRIRNAILGGRDWTVHPPDIKIDGTSNYELDYWKNLSQTPMPYGKKSSDLAVVGDVQRLK